MLVGDYFVEGFFFILDNRKGFFWKRLNLAEEYHFRTGVCVLEGMPSKIKEKY